MKQIICIKWGNKYSNVDVNNLYYMVKNNITPPFTFNCFTDNPSNLNNEIVVFDFPSIDFELRKHHKGKWDKCRLWNKSLGNLKGEVLFLDLDIVIVNNIDCFFSYKKNKKLILGRNNISWNPFIMKGQTSFFRFQVGELYPILEKFKKNQSFYQNKYNFEQTFVSNESNIEINFWPNEWINHFRNDCIPTFPLNYFIEPSLTKECKIVNFCGKFKVHNAIKGSYWFDEHYSPIIHIFYSIINNFKYGPLKVLKAIRRFIYPSKWLEKFIK